MANKVNKARLPKVKKGLKQGKSLRKAMLEANCSEGQASRGIAAPIAREALKQNRAEFKKIDVTIESVKLNLYEVRELARDKKDYSTMLQADIALGKLIAAFTDKVRTEGSNVTPQLEQELRNYIDNNRLSRLS